jgi:predicted dehydrogenase
MQRVRTALVGCGKVGQIHAAALRTVAESEFVAVCDSDPARAAAFAQQYGVMPFTDVAQMCRDAPAQALCVCTPHPLHAAAVIQAAEAGVHALVEKPLAANLADCDAMLAASRRAGTKLGVVSAALLWRCGHEDAIDNGKIGMPVLGVFPQRAVYYSRTRGGKWTPGGARWLVNQSPHHSICCSGSWGRLKR